MKRAFQLERGYRRTRSERAASVFVSAAPAPLAAPRDSGSATTYSCRQDACRGIHVRNRNEHLTRQHSLVRAAREARCNSKQTHFSNVSTCAAASGLERRAPCCAVWWLRCRMNSKSASSKGSWTLRLLLCEHKLLPLHFQRASYC